MHRFPTKSSVFRCRIASLLFLLRSLLPVAGFPMMAWAMITHHEEWFLVGACLMAALPVVVVIQWMVASRVRCPLCFMPPLLDRGCAKNRKATRLFFSYRLRVAVAVLFLGYFRCQYCGEPTVMKSRRR